jgi:hypothetical protein
MGYRIGGTSDGRVVRGSNLEGSTKAPPQSRVVKEVDDRNDPINILAKHLFTSWLLPGAGFESIRP